MFKLSVIDVSALVYAAMGSKFFRDRSYYRYPVGGIHYLMRYVTGEFSEENDVVLCFDSPSFRSHSNGSYKKGRKKNPAVISQLETLYEELSACGFRCEKYKGYEADDIVEWAVAQASDAYVDIRIVGNDKDLAHSVRGKVVFTPLGEDSAAVSASNFSYTVERGKEIMFNTISAYKTCCGCPSDTIPVFTSETGKRGIAIYEQFCDVLRENGYPGGTYYGADKELFLDFVTNYAGLTSADIAELNKRADLVYPAPCPDGVVIEPVKYKEIDKDAFQRFLIKYHDMESLKCLKFPYFDFMVDKELLYKKADALQSGEFMADRNMPAAKIAGTQVLRLDQFEKEF